MVTTHMNVKINMHIDIDRVEQLCINKKYNPNWIKKNHQKLEEHGMEIKSEQLFRMFQAQTSKDSLMQKSKCNNIIRLTNIHSKQ